MLRRARRRWIPACGFVVGAGALVACNAILGNTVLTLSPDAAADKQSAGKPDARMDASADASGDGDRHGDADGSATDAAYYPIGEDSRWSVLDIKTVVPTAATSFSGAAFDGRYLYLVPSAAGDAVVYDTRSASFDAGEAWNSFNPATRVTAGPFYFTGGVWDGHHVNYVPNGGQGGQDDLMLLRFDTDAGQNGFSATSSWQNQDLCPDAACSFAGGAFDGRFVYVVPTGVVENLIRFDPKSPGSSDSFSVSSYVQATFQAQGAAYDGEYIYLMPGESTSYAVRHRVGDALDGGWEKFDLTGVTGGQAYWGGVFDGRYIYYVPNTTSGGSPAGTFVRFDTSASFRDTTSWSVYDLADAMAAPTAVKFAGGTFDGRYVYFAPTNGPFGSLVARRFDTTAGKFDEPTAWSSFDMATLNGVGPDAGCARTQQFFGAAFDGRYVYFVPNSCGVLVRFEARSPSAIPVFAKGGVASFL